MKRWVLILRTLMVKMTGMNTDFLFGHAFKTDHTIRIELRFSNLLKR